MKISPHRSPGRPYHLASYAGRVAVLILIFLASGIRVNGEPAEKMSTDLWTSLVQSLSKSATFEIHDKTRLGEKVLFQMSWQYNGFYCRRIPLSTYLTSELNADDGEAGMDWIRYWYRETTNVFVWDNNAFVQLKLTNSVFSTVYNRFLRDVGMICNLGIPSVEPGFIDVRGTNIVCAAADGSTLYGWLKLQSNCVTGVALFSDPQVTKQVGWVMYEYQRSSILGGVPSAIIVKVLLPSSGQLIDNRIEIREFTARRGFVPREQFQLNRCMADKNLKLFIRASDGIREGQYRPSSIFYVASNPTARRSVRITYWLGVISLSSTVIALGYRRRTLVAPRRGDRPSGANPSESASISPLI